jgi:hypothetical protein
MWGFNFYNRLELNALADEFNELYRYIDFTTKSTGSTIEGTYTDTNTLFGSSEVIDVSQIPFISGYDQFIVYDDWTSEDATPVTYKSAGLDSTGGNRTGSIAIPLDGTPTEIRIDCGMGHWLNANSYPSLGQSQFNLLYFIANTGNGYGVQVEPTANSTRISAIRSTDSVFTVLDQVVLDFELNPPGGNQINPRLTLAHFGEGHFSFHLNGLEILTFTDTTYNPADLGIVAVQITAPDGYDYAPSVAWISVGDVATIRSWVFNGIITVNGPVKDSKLIVRNITKPLLKTSPNIVIKNYDTNQQLFSGELPTAGNYINLGSLGIQNDNTRYSVTVTGKPGTSGSGIIDLVFSGSNISPVNVLKKIVVVKPTVI